MSTMTYLASNDEVDHSARLFDTLEAAKKSQARYIDVFLNGRHSGTTYKLVNDQYLDMNSDEYRKADS